MNKKVISLCCLLLGLFLMGFDSANLQLVGETKQGTVYFDKSTIKRVVNDKYHGTYVDVYVYYYLNNDGLKRNISRAKLYGQSTRGYKNYDVTIYHVFFKENQYCLAGYIDYDKNGKSLVEFIMARSWYPIGPDEKYDDLQNKEIIYNTVQDYVKSNFLTEVAGYQ